MAAREPGGFDPRPRSPRPILHSTISAAQLACPIVAETSRWTRHQRDLFGLPGRGGRHRVHLPGADRCSRGPEPLHRLLFHSPRRSCREPLAISRPPQLAGGDRDGRSRIADTYLPGRANSKTAGGQIDVAAQPTVARQHRVRKARPPIPATPASYVKARVRVHEYPDGTLALFHGPRCLARYTANGEPIEAGRRFDATGRRPVDKWTAAPRLTTSPQGPQQQKRTYDVLRRTNPLASDSAPAAEAPLLPAGAVPGDFAAAQPA